MGRDTEALIQHLARVRIEPALVLIPLLLVAAWPQPAAAAPRAQQDPVQCLHQATAPPPPDGGAVITFPYDPNDNSAYNVLVLAPTPGRPKNYVQTQWGGECFFGRTAILRQPTSIAVGKGGALWIADLPSNRLSLWGGLSVESPVLFPGQLDFTPDNIQLYDSATFEQQFGGCQGCQLDGLEVNWERGGCGSGLQCAYSKSLRGAHLDNTTWKPGFYDNPPDLAGWDLSGASMVNAQGLQGADLSGANLSGATLELDLSGANFSGATLSTHLEKVGGLKTTNLTGADLSGATLNGVDLSGATLSNVTVSGTVFDGADLRGAHLRGLQSVAGPSFKLVKVGPFNGACTSFQDADLRNATITLGVTAGCEQSAMLPDSTVSLGTLAGWLMSRTNVNLTTAIFAVDASDRSSLAGLDLSGLDLSKTAFIGWPLELSGTKLDNATLAGAILNGADLGGASLHNVNAAGASFQGARLTARGNLPAASFGGAQTNLQNAVFIDADVSGASFASADVSGAAFDRVLAVGTDFNGVKAVKTSFTGAHIYGDGQAFDNARDLTGADFSGAVMAGDVSQGGGFNLTATDLTGAHFDYAQCIGCNFTSSKLDQASFTWAYLLGAVFANVTMQDTNLYNAWLYCGDVDNGHCAKASGASPGWTWPLPLGFGEAYGPVPFAGTNVTGLAQQHLKLCPDGTSGANTPGCAFRLLPDQAGAPPIPAACSAAAYDACPTSTDTVFDASELHGKLLSVAPMIPPTWATSLPDRAGYAVGFDDGTVQRVGGGTAQILAGTPGEQCAQATHACGDGGPASQAQLGTPAGLAVGLDGSLYIADPALHRVRKVDPSGNISTVVGSGAACSDPAPSACGNGGAASAAQLSGPYGVWVDPRNRLYIADGPAGLRLVSGGIVSALTGTAAYDVRSVVGDANGGLYAAAHAPADYLVQVDLTSGQVSVVVGNGTSGYNGNLDVTGMLAAGTDVQIDKPGGMSVDLNGNILFADTGNNLVRAYVPDQDTVIDDLGGKISDAGVPQAGFNGDCQWANQTELNAPVAVAATGGAWVVVADAGNSRVRQLGPSPLNADTPPVCPSQSDTSAALTRGLGAPRPAPRAKP